MLALVQSAVVSLRRVVPQSASGHAKAKARRGRPPYMPGNRGLNCECCVAAARINRLERVSHVSRAWSRRTVSAARYLGALAILRGRLIAARNIPLASVSTTEITRPLIWVKAREPPL